MSQTWSTLDELQNVSTHFDEQHIIQFRIYKNISYVSYERAETASQRYGYTVDIESYTNSTTIHSIL